MIGDSLQRYQYLSLAYFIEHGKWHSRFEMVATDTDKIKCSHIDENGNPTCSEPNNPSLLSENDWAHLYSHAADKSWKEMHMSIGGKSSFNGKMECQCARLQSDTSTEAMFYEGQSTKLTFISNIGDNPMHWWKRENCSINSSCILSSTKWDQLKDRASKLDWDYIGDIIDITSEKGYISQQYPDIDIAIFNRGLWGNIEPKKLKRIMKNLYKLTSKNKNGKCFWKGTSVAFSDGNAHG